MGHEIDAKLPRVDMSVVVGVGNQLESVQLTRPHLRVQMLGPLSVFRDGVALALPASRKARAHTPSAWLTVCSCASGKALRPPAKIITRPAGSDPLYRGRKAIERPPKESCPRARGTKGF